MDDDSGIIHKEINIADFKAALELMTDEMLKLTFAAQKGAEEAISSLIGLKCNEYIAKGMLAGISESCEAILQEQVKRNRAK